MKKFFLFAAAAVAMTAACSKSETAPKVDEKVYYNPPREDGSYEVKFNTNPLSVQSKSLGAIGGVAGENNWSGKETLFIYGFNRNIGVANPDNPADYVADFTQATIENGYCLINNVSAEAPAGTEKDGIKVYKNRETGEPFFYTPEDCYDFYGYYIDDAANNVDENGTPVAVVEADRVYVPFTIDGGQDLMIAKADQTLDIEGTEVKKEAYAYSAYSARRNVVPNLKFEHQLSRFIFKIMAGANSENATNVTINSLSVKSKTSGNLVVATMNDVARGIADVDESSVEELYLKEKDADGTLVDLGSAAPVKPTEEFVKIGESLLLMPGETEYYLTMNISQENHSGIIVPQKFSMKIPVPKDSEAKVFEAGHQYTVLLTIYGLEEVKINVELTPWIEGEEIPIDPDKKDEE